MLKELFEGHFYGTFPKVAGCVLNLTEFTLTGASSLLDPKACSGCHFVCSSNPGNREQMKMNCSHNVNVISIDDVFSYVKENVGETCDYFLESDNMLAIVEMTCSTTDYVPDKRQKARHQLYNTLALLFTSPIVRHHIERQNTRYVVFSWKETFKPDLTTDSISNCMLGMTAMTDAVYSPDNESKFDFGFRMKEIRYPSILYFN